MTYLQFLLLLVVLPCVLLAGLLWWGRRELPAARSGPWSPVRAVVVLVLVALAYTTPWDNLLVALGVWGYPPERVLARIGYVPVEEYLFFALQTVLAALTWLWLRRRLPASGPMAAGLKTAATQRTRGLRLRRVALLVLALLMVVGVAALGLRALGRPGGTYLGLILVWAVPALALQWGFGGDLILRRGRLFAAAVALPTLYLWAADRLAIGLGIWWISAEQTTGVKLVGLPLEEALFFVVTNLLVVGGMTLLLAQAAPGRLRRWQRAAARWRWRWRRARSPRMPLEPLPGVLLLLWLLTMIPIPLWPDAFPALVYVNTVVLATLVTVVAYRRVGSRVWLLLGLSLLFGWLVELLGSTTGVPFGRYAYTAPGPALLGVPLLVPIGWWAFPLLALVAAPRRRRWLVAPLALVAWDAGLDPLMVKMGFWEFAAASPYHGVPPSNFVGWFVAGMLLLGVLQRLEPRLAAWTSRELRLVFALQAVLMAIGLAWFGLFLAAGVSAVAMAVVMLGWRAPASGVTQAPSGSSVRVPERAR